jgi:hypothetical protein
VIVAHAGTGADAAAVILLLAGLLALVWGLRATGRRRTGALAGAALLAVAGVTAPAWAPATTSTSQRPTTRARVAIVAPAAGATVGSSFEVHLRLEGGRLASLSVVRLVPDEGHIHLALDGRVVAMSPGLDSSLNQVPPGRHTLTAEFVANDHGSYRPPVVAGVSFTVA